MAHRYIGKRLPQLDSFHKVTGIATFTHDLELPGMLYAKLVTSIYPHAKVSKVDASEALKVPGVVTIATGRDFPYRLGIYVGDRDVLAMDKVNWVGHPVAAVVAETLEAAEKAVDLVEVEYEPLEPVFDPLKALEPDAPLIHPKLGEYRRAPAFTPVPGTNIANRFVLKRGNVEKGFEESNVVIEKEFKLPFVSHAYLETQSTIAQYKMDGTVEVWTSAQSPFAVRYLMALSLGIPVGNITVNVPFVGGGFGGKAGLAWEPLTALLSKKAGYRPVKLELSRKEQFTSGAVRDGVYAKVKAGAKKDGRLMALKGRLIFDAGGYGDYTVNVSRAAGYSFGEVYDLPNVYCESLAVYTNKVPTTAMRGFGHPEAVWAVERTVEMVSSELGVDPLEIRLKNVVKPGVSVTVTGEKLRKDAGNPSDCLDAVAKAINWGGPVRKPGEPWRYIGKGISVFCKGPAQPPNAASSAIIKLNEDGTVDLMVGTGNFGQGTVTSLTQIVAEELGIPVEKVKFKFIRGTDSMAYTWQTVGSRGLYTDGNAVLEALEDVKKQIKEVASQVLRVKPEDLEIRDEKVYLKGRPWESIPLSELVMGYTYPNGNSIGGPIIGRGKYISPLNTYLDPETGQGIPTIFYTYGATGCIVEVDALTGKVRVLKAVQAFDLGKAINPLMVECQIDGGFIMGMSVALFEEITFDERGWVQNPNFSAYWVAHARDIPDEMMEISIENPQSDGPYGARGIGEVVMLGVPPAIANAVYHAIGVNINNMPMHPENIWKEIKKQKPELLEELKRKLMEIRELKVER